MIVMSPARADDRITLRSDSLAEVIKTIGTDGYGRACLGLFEQSLDADHWALFHYRASNSVGCIATASRMYVAAAQENINRFVGRCYRVDPSLIVLKQQHPESACVIKIEIGDRDRQYRHCFESTHVQERLSFFSRLGSELHQLSVYRGARRRPFSSLELTHFSTLASLVLATAQARAALQGSDRHPATSGSRRHRAVPGAAAGRAQQARTRGLLAGGRRQDHRGHRARAEYPKDQRRHLSPARLPEARHFPPKRAGCTGEQHEVGRHLDLRFGVRHFY
jgi:hypothetical protein